VHAIYVGLGFGLGASKSFTAHYRQGTLGIQDVIIIIMSIVSIVTQYCAA